MVVNIKHKTHIECEVITISIFIKTIKLITLLTKFRRCNLFYLKCYDYRGVGHIKCVIND